MDKKLLKKTVDEFVDKTYLKELQLKAVDETKTFIRESAMKN